MRCLPLLVIAAVWLTAAGGLCAQEVSSEPGFAVPAFVARRISAGYRDLDDWRRRLEAELVVLASPPRNERSARVGWKVFGYDEALAAQQWVEIDLGSGQRVDAIALIPVDAPASSGNEPGIGFPVRFRAELIDDHGARTVIADYTTTDFPNPGALPVYLPARGTTARRVRITMSKPWSRNRHQTYAFGEIMVLQGNRNLATGRSGVTVQSSDSLESPPGWSRENLIDGQSVVGAPLVRSGRPLAHGWESARFTAAAATAWVQIDLGRGQSFDEVRLVPARLLEFGDLHGYGFPGRLRVELADDADFTAPRVLAEWSVRSRGNPGFNPLTFPGDGRPARYVRVTASDLWQRREGAHVFALAELQVYDGDRNVALGAPVTADRESPAAPANMKPDFLTDGLRSTQKLVDWPDWLQSLSRRRELLAEVEHLRGQLAALQPALVRTLAWSTVGALAALAAGGLALVNRARRAQARTVMELQRRIAGDLHDEIGSNLASIAMLTELSQRQRADLPAEDVTEIRRLATESAAAMRDIVWLIQPGPHDAPRLADRLRAAARRLLGGMEWSFEISGLEQAPPLDVQRHLLLALKEMLHNVLRHAAARRVEIRLSVRDDRFELAVRDDGRGWTDASFGDGHGLTSLRHRAGLLGGELSLDCRPGQGTSVALSGALRSVTQPFVSSS